MALFTVVLLAIIGWATLPQNFKRILEPTAEASTFTVTTTADSGAGSLRAAILNANGNGNGTIDTITFNIPGAGVHTIKPLTELPHITTPTIIDGYSQPGASANTLDVGNNAVLLIEIDGSSTPENSYGITIEASASTIKGLVINNFAGGEAIALEANDSHIRGNFIGTDPTGAIARPNDYGVTVNGNNNDIGWVTAADRNLISGNVWGLQLDGDGCMVFGNYIGTNAQGTQALGNSYVGIGGGGKNNTIGNITATTRNVVSGNAGSGIYFINVNNKIQGNYIGVNAAGNAVIGNAGDGIELFGATGTIIGGTNAGAGNIIGGNQGNGIAMRSSLNASIQNVTVQGNYIGTDLTGTLNLGNTLNGIHTGDILISATIGGTGSNESNTIAFNKEAGINVAYNSTAKLSGNKIYSNGKLGIDLGTTQFTNVGNGVTLNDTNDADGGPNGLQNFPVLTSAQNSGGITTIQGTLNSTANTQFDIEFFANTSCDPSGYGEGQTYIGSTTVTTVGNDVSFSKALPGFNAGQFITATATSVGVRTSEFSQCIYVVSPAAGTLAFGSSTYTVNESGTATVTVKRVGGSSGAVSVQYATVPGGTATAGVDYTSASGTLTWADGDTSDKTFNVAIINDLFDEPDETINLSLTSPAGGAALSNPSTASITIADDDATPSVSINDVSVTEGNSGTTNAVFSVTLSSASNQTVKVDFATANGTATAGSDYQSQSGTLTFAPGDLSKTITVLVNGDTANEANETFFVNLSNAQNSTIGDNQGLGTILNDDAPGVQFSANAFSFLEGAGHGDIFVTRTGDTSAPLDVDYSTSDQSGLTPCQSTNTGFASERCDYVTAVGTLKFASGEAQKTIPLVIINDAYMDGSEQLNIKLTNPVGGTLGSVDTATVTITDDDVQLAVTNPIDDLDFFIRQQYADFLGREPDAAGFQFWKARMTNNCPPGDICDRIDTSFRFFQSDEFKERGYFIYLFYHAALGRRPTYSEWITDVSRLNGPKTVAEQEAAKDAFVVEFMGRQEFINLYNQFQTGQTFVEALVQRSGVTPASKQLLIDNYANVGRAKTLRAFLETPEVQAQFFDRSFITMLYFGYLRRDAEAGGFDFWMQKLNSTNHDYRFMVGGFLQSDEYRFRFALISAP